MTKVTQDEFMLDVVRKLNPALKITENTTWAEVLCKHRDDRLESLCCGVELEDGSKSATDVCSSCRKYVSAAECNACGQEIEL